MYQQYAREGRLTHPTDWERYTLFDLTFRPLGMTETQLVEGFRDLARRLYSREFTQWRRDRFRRHYTTARRRRRQPLVAAGA
jgi:hypothetical protein